MKKFILLSLMAVLGLQSCRHSDGMSAMKDSTTNESLQTFEGRYTQLPDHQGGTDYTLRVSGPASNYELKPINDVIAGKFFELQQNAEVTVKGKLSEDGKTITVVEISLAGLKSYEGKFTQLPDHQGGTDYTLHLADSAGSYALKPANDTVGGKFFELQQNSAVTVVGKLSDDGKTITVVDISPSGLASFKGRFTQLPDHQGGTDYTLSVPSPGHNYTLKPANDAVGGKFFELPQNSEVVVRGRLSDDGATITVEEINAI